MVVETVSVSVAEAQTAVAAVVQCCLREHASPVAVAVVDGHGDLIAFARMDDCGEHAAVAARKKAYTAARTRTDTGAYAERLASQGRSVAELGNPGLLAIQGGLVITHSDDHRVAGAIGVSGLAPHDDEALARTGIDALLVYAEGS